MLPLIYVCTKKKICLQQLVLGYVIVIPQRNPSKNSKRKKNPSKNKKAKQSSSTMWLLLALCPNKLYRLCDYPQGKNEAQQYGFYQHRVLTSWYRLCNSIASEKIKFVTYHNSFRFQNFTHSLVIIECLCFRTYYFS